MCWFDGELQVRDRTELLRKPHLGVKVERSSRNPGAPPNPDGKRRAGGMHCDSRESDSYLKLAKVLAPIENGTWRLPDDTMSEDLNPKTITLRQATTRYSKGRVN